MTTTGTRWSPAAPAIVLLVLLATALLFIAESPTFGDDESYSAQTTATSIIVPEPATLVFVGIAGLELFRRGGRLRLR